jgi:hypothetical protein
VYANWRPDSDCRPSDEQLFPNPVKEGLPFSSETIRKTLRLGWIFFLSAACFMISGVVLFRLNIAEKSFA